VLDISWRVVVRFADDRAARTVYETLGREKGQAEIETVTIDRATVSVFTWSEAAAKELARRIRREAESAGASTLSVKRDRWLPEEARWSGDRSPRRESSSGTWSLVAGFLDLWP
jgi:hypothetical protein